MRRSRPEQILPLRPLWIHGGEGRRRVRQYLPLETSLPQGGHRATRQEDTLLCTVVKVSPVRTCASDSGQHPGLALVHRPASARAPLPQDGRAAPALAQQGPLLGSLGLRGGQDTLLLESVQLFGETRGCYVSPRMASVRGAVGWR